MTANFERLIIAESARRSVGEIIHHHHRANETANGLRVRRDPKPFVQGPTFVRLEVAEPDPAQLRWSDDGRDSFKRGGEHFLEPRMHQERLVIFYEKLVELYAIRGMKHGDSVHIWGDFGHFTVHVNFPLLPLTLFNAVLGAVFKVPTSHKPRLRCRASDHR